MVFVGERITDVKIARKRAANWEKSACSKTRTVLWEMSGLRKYLQAGVAVSCEERRGGKSVVKNAQNASVLG